MRNIWHRGCLTILQLARYFEQKDQPRIVAIKRQPAIDKKSIKDSKLDEY